MQQSGVASEQRSAWFEQLRQAAAAVPGVAQAARRSRARSPRRMEHAVAVPGGLDADAASADVLGQRGQPGWFDTYGVKLAAGRDVDGTDRHGAPLVVVVNRAFASRFLNGGIPDGRQFSTEEPNSGSTVYQVVGTRRRTPSTARCARR